MYADSASVRMEDGIEKSDSGKVGGAWVVDCRKEDGAARSCKSYTRYFDAEAPVPLRRPLILNRIRHYVKIQSCDDGNGCSTDREDRWT